MTPGFYERACELFDQALALSPQERSDFLRRECNGDERLRQEAERLLAADQSIQREGIPFAPLDVRSLLGFARSSTQSVSHEQRVESVLPSRVGEHEILEKISHGGQGVVYKARHSSLNRLVALKMIRDLDFAEKDKRQRFQREAQAIAKLTHTNIVQIYEIGEHEGQPYFSMELVEGGTLANRLNGAPLQGRESAHLVELLARAIDLAHQHQVIHRDLKPANVLMTEANVPKITDFGLAKTLDDTVQTQTGTIVGTPSYLAPEQAKARSESIGPETDVYALGAILYQCLTGRPPFRAATTVDTLFQVLSEEPIPPHRLQPSTPKDLETICLKCLQKEPHKRYRSANALAEDLRRYQNNEPILARPVGTAERLYKWTRRQPATAGLLGVTLLLLVLLPLGIVYYVQKNEADRQRDEAQRQRNEADRQRERAEASEQRTQRLVYLNKINYAHQLWKEGSSSEAWKVLQGTEPNLRHWEYWYLLSLFNPVNFVGHENTITSVAFAPNGHRIVTGSIDRTIRVWNAHTGKELHRWNGHTGSVTSVAYSPDGKRVVSGGGSVADPTVKLWDATTCELIRTMKGHLRGVRSVAFSPDGRRIVSGGGWVRDASVKVWDATTGQALLTLEGHTREVNAVAFSPDGLRIASAGKDRSLKLWNAQTGRPILAFEGHTSEICSLAFSPDGERIASGSKDQTVRVWDAHTGLVQFVLAGHRGEVHGVAYSADGQKIASVGQDKAVRVWNAQNGKEMHSFKGHLDATTCVAFSPSGQFLVSGSGSVVRNSRPIFPQCKVWNVRTGQGPQTLQGHTQPVMSVAFTPDGRRILTSSWDKTLKLWDCQTGRETSTLEGHTTPVPIVACSHNGRWLASGAHGGSIKLWDADSGKCVKDLAGHTGHVFSLVFSPDDRCLASGGADHTIRLWDTQTGTKTKTLEGHSMAVATVAFSPDGQWLASGSWDKTIKLWDARTGAEVRTLGSHDNWVLAVQFAPDGRQLASGSADHTIRFWNVETGRHERTLDGHTHYVDSVSFSPDGQRLVSGGRDNSIKVWDTQTSQQTLSLKGHTGFVNSVVFSPKGHQIVSGSWDNTAKVWDVTPTSQRSRQPLLSKPSWHQEQARRYERLNQWFAAEFHWNRASRAYPLRMDLLGRWLLAALEQRERLMERNRFRQMPHAEEP